MSVIDGAGLAGGEVGRLPGIGGDVWGRTGGAGGNSLIGSGFTSESSYLLAHEQGVTTHYFYKLAVTRCTLSNSINLRH